MEISIETNFEDQVEMNYYFQTSNGVLKKNYIRLILTSIFLSILFFISLRNSNEIQFPIFFSLLTSYFIVIISTLKYNIKRNLTKYLQTKRASTLNNITQYNFEVETMYSKNDEMETIVPYKSFHYFTFRNESIYLTLNNGIIYIFKWRNTDEKNELIETFEQISDKHQVLIYRNEK
jgi:hypothetical protein